MSADPLAQVLPLIEARDLINAQACALGRAATLLEQVLAGMTPADRARLGPEFRQTVRLARDASEQGSRAVDRISIAQNNVRLGRTALAGLERYL